MKGVNYLGNKNRNFIGTLNNPTVDPKEYLEKWHTTGKAKYVVG